MMQHARQLSDIRSVNAPPFQMKATFSFAGEHLETIDGTFTETWISDSQWRRDITVRDLRHSEVRGPDKRWIVYPDGFPFQTERLAGLLDPFPPALLKLDFASITEHADPNRPSDCAVTIQKPHYPKLAFCFAKNGGLLLEKALPERHQRDEVVTFSCEYGAFNKFGDFLFPREAVCFKDGHKVLTVSVVELSSAPPLDASLFVPPAGSIELGECSGKNAPIEPPLVDSGKLHLGWRPERERRVRVWLVVDAKGNPQNLKVQRSVDKDSDERTLSAIRTWRFGPARCDGKPMPAEMVLEIPSIRP